MLGRMDCSAHSAKVTSSNSAISRDRGRRELESQVNFTIYNKSANGYRFTAYTALNCINQAFFFFLFNHIAEQEKVFQVKLHF